MRILMLTHHVSWRSRLARSTNWGRWLARKGHAVTILEISDNHRFKSEVSQKDGVTYIGTPDLLVGRARSGWDIWDVLTRISFVLSKRFDIVHSIDSRPVTILPALISKYFRKAKLILDWGDWWGRGGVIQLRSDNIIEKVFSPIETFFEEAFRRYADGSIVFSSALKDRAIALGVPSETILQTTTGADVERILPRNQSEDRERLGFDNKTKIIGYVGALYKADQHLLTEAFKIIYDLDPSIYLMMIGRKSPKKLDLNPEQLHHVIFVGDVSAADLCAYISACDVMLLPLKNNTMSQGRSPAKIGDYLAAGKPIVATKIKDIIEIIESGKCGVLAEDTPEDFAQKTIDLLSHVDLIMSMGKNARSIAETKYNWRILTDQLEDFYYKILNS